MTENKTADTASSGMESTIPPQVIGAVLAAGIMSFCGVIVETAMNITFPTLMKEFRVGTDSVQWMTTLYLLVVASITPLSAALKRRFTDRTLFLWANLLFLVGVLIDGMAGHFWLLLLGRAVQGLGTSIALPLMFNIILDKVPARRIGTMMGVGTLITAIGPAVGPTFGGLVSTTIGWRFIFVFLVPVLLASLILGLVCIRAKPAFHQAAGLNPVDVLLIVLSFSGLIFAISNASAGVLSWRFTGSLSVGIASMTWFIYRSIHQNKPIIDMRLFTDKLFSLHICAYILYEVCALALSFILPNYIQLVNGRNALQAGLIVLPGAALGAVLAPLSGRIYDQLGARVPILSGSLISMIGLTGFALFGRRLSDGLIIVLYICFMLGIGLSFGNIMTNGLRQLTQGEQTDGNAIFNTVQQFAAALGSSTAATLVSAGQAAETSQRLGTIEGSWHTFVLLVVLGFAETALAFILTVRRRSAYR
ncbi:MFS transporter [Bifidobacterium indicum]|uniref:MFS transporter n=1 Tax=Bifidobacterium indicum TaxID=1691 RepID=UPI0030DCD714